MEHKLKNLFRRSHDSPSPPRGGNASHASQTSSTPQVPPRNNSASGSLESQRQYNDKATDQGTGLTKEHELQRVLSKGSRRTQGEDDKEAHLPALPNRRSQDLAEDLSHMSLGGDARLRSNEGTKRHQEDVANRNIARWGSGSNRQYSTPDPGDIFPPEVPNRNSSAGIDRRDNVGRRESVSPPDNREPHYRNRADWPARVARDEVGPNQRKQRGNTSSASDDANTRRKPVPLRHPPGGPEADHANLRTAYHDGGSDDQPEEEDQPDHVRYGPSLDGVVDLNDSVDVDRTTRYAPAVTHEVIKPHEHEIITEKIHREIHNYDVYHRVLPVHEVEILAAKHFVHDDKGKLVEVDPSTLPDYTGENQRWQISKREDDHLQYSQMPSVLTEPRITEDTRYKTPEGYERRETTWLHPPALEDMSGYGGPVLDMHFHHEDAPGRKNSKTIPTELVPARKASKRKPVASTNKANRHSSGATETAFL